MWPVNAQQCIRKLKTYVPDPPQPSLPRPDPRLSHPEEIADVQRGMEKWGPKIRRGILWSDPAHEDDFNSFVDKSKEVFTKSMLKERELDIYRTKRLNQLHGRRVNRKRLKQQMGGIGLTKENAMAELAAKLRKEKDQVKKKEENQFMKFWRQERDLVHTKGVAARKAEKARMKQVREMKMKGLTIPPELSTPIHDPEAEWKETNEVWKSQEAKKAAKKNPSQEIVRADESDEDVTINVGDNQPWYQKDYIPLVDEKDEDQDA